MTDPGKCQQHVVFGKPGILVPRLLGRALVRVQLPVWAADESEPEPDIAVVPPENYYDRHPDSVPKPELTGGLPRVRAPVFRRIRVRQTGP